MRSGSPPGRWTRSAASSSATDAPGPPRDRASRIIATPSSTLTRARRVPRPPRTPASPCDAASSGRWRAAAVGTRTIRGTGSPAPLVRRRARGRGDQRVHRRLVARDVLAAAVDATRPRPGSVDPSSTASARPAARPRVAAVTGSPRRPEASSARVRQASMSTDRVGAGGSAPARAGPGSSRSGPATNGAMNARTRIGSRNRVAAGEAHRDEDRDAVRQPRGEQPAGAASPRPAAARPGSARAARRAGTTRSSSGRHRADHRRRGSRAAVPSPGRATAPDTMRGRTRRTTRDPPRPRLVGPVGPDPAAPRRRG